MKICVNLCCKDRIIFLSSLTFYDNLVLNDHVQSVRLPDFFTLINYRDRLLGFHP